MIIFQGAAWKSPALLAGMLGLTLGFSSLPAKAAAPIFYEVSNYTNSAGDPTNDVTDDVLLTNLVLTETFADSTTRVDTLYDPSHTAQTSLDAFSFLDTNPLPLQNAASSALVSATLTGQIAPPAADNNGNGTFTLNTQTNAFDPTTAGTATVGPNFSATLFQFAPISSVEIFAQNPNGSNSANGIGTLAAVPESATWISFGILLALGGIALAFRKKASAH